MPTLKDVALRANVSKMTVSRVINHPEMVTTELRRLVYKAMEDLDYQPNPVAKALVYKKSLVVAVIVLEDLESVDPYFMKLIKGISAELNKHQYAFQLLTDLSQLQSIKQCDGYIVAGMGQEDVPTIKKLSNPVVAFGENDYGIPFVDSDNYQASREATRYAAELGYEHLTFLGIESKEGFEQAREEGYLDAFSSKLVTPKILRSANSASQVGEVLKRELPIPQNSCFICASDRIALGAERFLEGQGYRIPEDVGIIGFDGVFLDRVASPRLTTVKQSVERMGEICAKRLLDLIDHRKTKESYYHRADLVIGGTTRQTLRKESEAVTLN